MKAKRILGLVLTVLMLTAWALPAFAVTAEEAAETGSKMQDRLERHSFG